MKCLVVVENTSSVPLGRTQRIFLLVFSILLACILLVMRISLDSSKPLDSLALNSLEPEVALSNGKPTMIEFYADWCEACQKMAPNLLKLKENYDQKLNFVLLNVDNEKWLYLIDKYDVNGIPQINLFDKDSNLKGKSIGFKNDSNMKDILDSLLDNKPLSTSLLNYEFDSSITMLEKSKGPKDINPRSHG